MFHSDEVIEVVQETVTFNEEGSTAVAVMPPQVSASRDFLSAANDSLANDIKGFLSRPIEMNYFTWLASSAPTAVISPSINIPNDWLVVPMVNQKLQGFRYLKCDFVFRVQVNAQPFNAGRLMVYFTPFSDQAPSGSAITHFGGITGFRHVDLDLSESTSVEFRVPYIGPVSHFDLVSGLGHLGRVNFVVYSSLTGSSDVDGTVFLYAENIDVHMPTGLPMIYAVTREAEAQIKTERKAAAGGSVETISASVSSVARKLGTIPGLAEIANSVSWVSDAIGGVASIFGWSRPTDPSFAAANQLTYVRHMANYNGDAKSKPLGLDARNEVEIPMDMFNTSEDEMSLSHILQKSYYTDRFSMDKTQAPGVLLWSWPVEPTSCVKAITGVAPVQQLIRYNTMLSYISELFSFWRGSINYHFKIVKTVFHTARIRVIFVPGMDPKGHLSDVDINKCYSKIYDIRDTTSFDFSIPFVSNTVWLSLFAGFDPSSPSQVSANPVVSGKIFIVVLNSLRNPTSAADHIEFLVESSAGEDFQFAYLTNKNHFTPDYLPTSVTYVREADAQINCEPFFESRVMSNFNPNVLGIGEAVTSLRQILKRYNRLPSDMPAVTAGNLNTFLPFVSGLEFVGTYNINFDSLFQYITMLFRIQSGSMRVMFARKSTDAAHNGSSVAVQLRTYPGALGLPGSPYGSIAAASVTPFSGGTPYVKYFLSTENTLEVDVPFYQQYPAILSGLGAPTICIDSTSDKKGLVPYNPGSMLLVNNDVPLEVYRSIGEDFSLGYAVGPPLSSAFLTPPP